MNISKYIALESPYPLSEATADTKLSMLTDITADTILSKGKKLGLVKDVASFIGSKIL
ncbi:MAG TPA: hypothetical protein IAB06_03565 [Candidatus Avacidaminococcus intestinavium]|uniref:Uncharacterized protein n=1 Tax=Candidatus Avacidaminococcus intestinavium TaxID=2840684 RepID=A0A9D1MP84_9FIRM|nr:hypothetical protein [Candidatus Avacidaminococcus intestinavium]